MNNCLAKSLIWIVSSFIRPVSCLNFFEYVLLALKKNVYIYFFVIEILLLISAKQLGVDQKCLTKNKL